jgi:hypothetical protein
MLDSVGRRPQPGKPVPFRGAVTSSPRLEVTTQILAGLALLAALKLGVLASLWREQGLRTSRRRGHRTKRRFVLPQPWAYALCHAA